CGNPPPNTPPLASSYTPRPGSISYAGGTLYVADTAAPVIHVVDMFDTLEGSQVISPCNPIERAPLLPSSAENPARVVFAGKVSVATLPTPDLTSPSPLLKPYNTASDDSLRRFLYATDTYDGSVMVFDVSDSSTTR